MKASQKWMRHSIKHIPTATKKDIADKYVEIITKNQELLETCATLGKMLFELKTRAGRGNWGKITRHLPISYGLISNLIKLWKKQDRLRGGMTIFLKYGSMFKSINDKGQPWGK